MQTTGNVILNCRATKIKGYDTWVNFSNFDQESDFFLTSANSYQDSSKPSFYRVDNEQTKFSTYSLHLSNYYSLYTNSIASITTTNTDFTISIWAYTKLFPYRPNTDANRSSGNMSPVIFNQVYQYIPIDTSSNINPNVNLLVMNTTSNTWPNYDVTIPNVFSKWNHIAITRNGNTFRLFYNGIKYFEASRSDAKWRNNLVLGGPYCDQWFDDLVAIQGDCLWTSNFTPPTSYLLDNEYKMPDESIKKYNVMCSNIDRDKLFLDSTLKQY